MKDRLMRSRFAGLTCALLVLVLMGLTCSPALAVPARPGPIEVVQPDGTLLEIVKKGDESRSWAETLNGYSVIKNSADGYWHYAKRSSQGGLVTSGMVVGTPDFEPPTLEKHLAPVRKAPQYPLAERPPFSDWSLDSIAAKAPWDQKFVAVSGERTLLFIMVGFNDIDITTPLTVWHNQIFNKAEGAVSVANFYIDNSKGLITLSPAAHSQAGSPAGIVKVRLNTDHPDLGGGTTYDDDVELLEAALEAASDSVNFDGFDVNGNDVLDPEELGVYFVIAGYEASGSANTPSVWAHAWWFADFIVGSKLIPQLALNGELNDEGLLHPLGVTVHELGHSLFILPDLYDTNDTDSSNAGLGFFSAMATGSWGTLYGDEYGSLPVSLDAWSRLYLGWAKPAILAPNGGTQLFPPALSTNSIVRLGDMPSSPTDYYLVENRVYDKWDRGLDGFFPWYEGDGGLLVLHADTTVGTNNSRYVDHQGLVIVEANATGCFPSAPGTNCRGHYTNLYYKYNNDAFNETSTPAASFYNGAPVPITLSEISFYSPLMSAVLSRYNRGAPTVRDLSLTVYQNRAYTGTLECSDPDEDTCAFMVQADPARGTLELDSYTGEFTYTSDEDADADAFTYYASDGELTSAPAIVTLNVEVPNEPPVMDLGPLNRVVEAGQKVTIAFSVTDPEGLPLMMSVSGLPEGAALDKATDTLTWQTKLTTPLGIYRIAFTAIDTGEPVESTEKTVSIEVKAASKIVGGGGCFLEELLR